MKKIICYCSITIVALIVGCKKENNDPVQSNPNLIKNMSNSNGASLSFSYNSQGLISKMNAQTFEWTDGALIRTIENSPLTYTRNSAGYVISGPDGESYSYDSGNKIVSISGVGGTATYIWSSGNLISITRPDETITFEYYSDKIDNRDVGLKYFPWFWQIAFSGGIPTTGSKNLIKKITAPTGIFESTWEFDSQGRVSKRIDNDGSFESYTYVN